ncbi:hypothetical protein BP6252_10803 [Coleophoma cylindrospora]|uniref:FAD-binding PCMH-type domain-containing protein n=1 Tax=Coleophoma cylindrospora TaxID=1849047 RepID=A0A3D8QNJ6_9HELO|nr:hypothetical protein BP6252_10803 [Coleophoma cylindrospora]
MVCVNHLLILAAVFSASAHAQNASKDCKYVPTDQEWPSSSEWDNLNQTISGQLIAVQPVAISCYPGPLFNNDTCTEVNSKWTKCAWQADQPAGFCMDTGTLTCPPIVPPALTGQNCTLGNNPKYVVNATSPAHVAAGIKFAQKNNIRLVVKTTGHDFLHRSEGFGSLEIWMRYHRTGIDFQKTFQSTSGCQKSNWTGSALKVGGGYQWSDVYAVAKANNIIVVGGGAVSIGAIGGWMQGGGYGPAAHEYGAGADQVLEAQVALADGTIITANACQNTDIYTGIRGGGPSTYGVVLSATYKTYPMVSTVTQSLFIPFTPATRSTYLDTLAVLYSSFPDLSDAGYAIFGFWGQSNASLNGASPPGYFHTAVLFNTTVAEAQVAFDPVAKRVAAVGLNFTQTWTTYPDYWSLFSVMSATADDPGFPLGVEYSRFFDKKALQGNATSLRDMLEVVAGAPEDGAIQSNACMAGGKVYKNFNDPYSGANPGWHLANCLQITQRVWPNDASAALIASIKNDVTNVKGEAMMAFSPGTGTYMNEAGREDPHWKENFYGINYDRFLKIKKNRDPKSVFYCPTCVGSDEWAEDTTGRLCRV